MSTWDDKPNDYGHAIVMIDELRAENERLTSQCQTWDRAMLFENGRLHAENERLRAALKACVKGSRDWMDKAKAALANQRTVGAKRAISPGLTKKVQRKLAYQSGEQLGSNVDPNPTHSHSR